MKKTIYPLPKGIDYGAEECTLDMNGLSENTYAVNEQYLKLLKAYPEWEELRENAATGIEILFETFVHFGEVMDYIDHDNAFMVGRSEANGVNYFEPTIGISFNGKPSKALLDHLKINPQLVNYDKGFYSLKFKLGSKRIILKTTTITDTTPTGFSLPNGVFRFMEEGRHINDVKLNHFRDIYCISTVEDKALLEEHFQVPVPYYKDPNNPDDLVYLGILYDTLNQKVAKVKQYYYPHRDIREIIRGIDYVPDTILKLL